MQDEKRRYIAFAGRLQEYLGRRGRRPNWRRNEIIINGILKFQDLGFNPYRNRENYGKECGISMVAKALGLKETTVENVWREYVKVEKRLQKNFG
jgi:hypothetical protein